MEMRKIVKQAKDYCKASSSTVFQIKFASQYNASTLTDLGQWDSKVYEFMSPVFICPNDVVLCLVKPGTADATITIGKCIGSIPIECCDPRTLAVNTGFILSKMDITWFTSIIHNHKRLDSVKRNVLQKKFNAQVTARLYENALKQYIDMGGTDI